MRTAVTSLVPNWGKSRACNPLINTQVRGWSLKHPRNRLIPLVFKLSIFSLRIQGSWTSAMTVSYSDSCLHRTEAAARQYCKLIWTMQIELLTCGGVRRWRFAAPVPGSFPAQPYCWRWKDPASTLSADSQSSSSLRLPATGLTTADIVQLWSVNSAFLCVTRHLKCHAALPKEESVIISLYCCCGIFINVHLSVWMPRFWPASSLMTIGTARRGPVMYTWARFNFGTSEGLTNWIRNFVSFVAFSTHS